MATVYPARLDNSTTLPSVVDGVTVFKGDVVNRLRDAIVATETELGVKPSGTFATVRARLDSLESAINSITGGTLTISGDIGGTSTHLLVIGLFGHPLLNTAPSAGQVLVWDGFFWRPGASFTPAGDLSGTALNQTVVGLQGRPILSTAPTSNQYLGWNGSAWVPESITNDQVTPGYVIGLNGQNFAEVGQDINNPIFTATYTLTPATAHIQGDQVGDPLQDVSGTSNSFIYNRSYGPTGGMGFGSHYGDTVTFTLSSTSGIFSKTAVATIIWAQRIYFGVAAPGGSTGPFIQLLDNQFLATDWVTNFTVNVGPGEAIYFAYRTGLNNTGLGGSIVTDVGGTVTLTGGANFTSNDLGKYITITNATDAGNNGQFLITAVLSSSSLKYFNSNAVAPDPANPNVDWSINAAFVSDGFLGGFDLISATIPITNAFGFTENYSLYRSHNTGLNVVTVNVF